MIETPRLDALVPYLPRIVIEWAREDPDARWRELDGTMAFVDVSGFTAMSERLSGFGKAGAEEVTEVMNATFTRLLEVAYGEGGGLVKFGGDALLLFFDGEGHASRAARAAFGMRRALRALGRPRTSAGAVTLRMHVGIHSGRFHFFLVGDSHRELIVTGPAASSTVAMEATSEAGEILLSEATAALVDPRTLGAPKGEGRLLRSAPAGSGRLTPLPEVEGIELERYVPAAIRPALATSAVEPEHRHAAVGFLRFAGADALLATEGAEALTAAVDELVRTVQGAADAHGVCFLETDIDRDGGRIVLVAGAPQTSENDEERLLRTVRAVIESNLRLQLHVGVSRGRVFAGEVGASFRRTYTILGDTAALAARLMARAAPGEVLAAVEVVERSRTLFATTELEPFRVKGKSEPVRAVAVGPVEGTRDVRERRRLPMVDRERELAVLGATLAPVRMGFGSFVELVGDAGIGKSRLVEEIREQSADMAQVETACERYEASTPYFAFRNLLRSLLELELDGSPEENSEQLRARLEPVAPDLVPWIPLLALPLDAEVTPTRETDELEPAFRRARIHGAVTSLLTTVLDQPTLLLFEDVHWMDEASSELLRHLGTQLATRPWFACATRRPVDGGFSATQGTPPLPALTLRLDPLPAADARRLAESAAVTPIDEVELDAIAERAGGNPLFLQELVGASTADAGVAELPETVEAVVASRIDELEPADRALLRWASVLGPSFSGDLIAEVLAGDPSAAAGSEAWDRLAEFVERDPAVAGGFRFRHALIRDAAYEGLSLRRRRELHARVGAVLEARAEAPEEVAELLSLHYALGGDAERTWRFSVLAGDRAREKGANIEAAGFYRRALELTLNVPGLTPADVVRMWEALGDVSELAGRYRDAAAAYRSGRRLAERTDPQPGLLLKEGVMREREGRYADALRWYRRGLDAAKSLPAEQARRHRVELALAYAGVRHRQGLFGECVRWCKSVLDDALESGDLSPLAHAYYLLHIAHTRLGSPERVAFRGLALPIYEELGDLLGQANVLNNLGTEAYYDGRWHVALDLYGRSRALRERIGDVVGAATIANNEAEIRSDQGHLDEAEVVFREAYDVCAGAGYLLICHVATSNLGRVALRAGRLDEAAELLDTALAGFRDLNAASFLLETQARIAERHLHTGDAEGAFALAGEALAELAKAESSGALAALLERVRGAALLLGGDLSGARECLDRSLRAGREAAAPYEVALTLEFLAEAALLEGVDGEAEPLRAESAEILEHLGVVMTPRLRLR